MNYRALCATLILFLAAVISTPAQQTPATPLPGMSLAGAPGAGTPPTPTPVVTDPTAVALAQRSIGALGAASIKDVTLTGTAIRTAGSDVESGTITLKALGSQLSRVEIDLPGGRFVELRGADAKGLPKSSWTGPEGTAHSMAGHNTLTDAVWFFPALSSLSRDPAKNPTLSVSRSGAALPQQPGGSSATLHFATHQPASASSASSAPPPLGAARLEDLSAVDIALDAATSLPASLRFNAHPDNNALVNIPVEIRFSDYRQVGGISVPFHIQKLLNGTLYLDIAIQSAAINTGIQAAEFTAQ